MTPTAEPGAQGRVPTGVADGRVLRLHHPDDPRAARVEVPAETGGRPLGPEFLPDGDLVVCDAERGLPRVDTADGTVRAAVHAPYRPSGTVGVVAVDDRGRTVHQPTRRRSGFRMVTSVCVTGDHLVLGSVREPGAAVCARPALR